ncbi:MAG: threonine dehydratase, partial [Crocinitomicaceae bacterium]|nr:threonine dehydratase [Crocinitomicaceae bacterium]
MYKVTLEKVREAAAHLEPVVLETPLVINETQSRKYSSSIFFKREDLQQVRSYKIRGAYNKISSLQDDELKNG